MIDVKSNQIQMLTKGQTGKNSDREPVVFSEFSLGAGSGDDSLGKEAPNDVTDDSAIADPGVLPLVGKAVAWIRLDNAPPQMAGNLNPILATYDKRPPAQPAVDADEQGGRKPPGPAKVGRIAVDLAATGRAEVPGHRETPGATLRSGRAQGRLDAIAPSRPSETARMPCAAASWPRCGTRRSW